MLLVAWIVEAIRILVCVARELAMCAQVRHGEENLFGSRRTVERWVALPSGM